MKKLTLFLVMCAVALGAVSCGSKSTSSASKGNAVSVGTQADRQEQRDKAGK